MYTILLHFDAYCSDGLVTFERTIHLPFPPFVGLQIWHRDRPDNADTVEAVVWLAGSERFACHVEDDEAEEPFTRQQAVAWYTERGWRVQKNTE